MKFKHYFVLFLIFVFFAGFVGDVFAAESSKRNLLINVPFTSQAPLGEWKDQRQQDGCEEASVLMAMAWVGGEKNIIAKNWRLRIIILSDFEKKKYGEYRDVSLRDIEAWLFRDYFKYKNTAIRKIQNKEDIIKELEAGNLVIAPTNGKTLKNPNFSGAGPERHMLLINGYDYKNRQFITNDPGTRKGESYRYDEKVILNAIRAYTTGYHEPIKEIIKEVIVVSPKK
jgi:hypothetical protein